ncbi:hypothetical protein V1507DRAFT_46440 [Lipomyces tetrasporus]
MSTTPTSATIPIEEFHAKLQEAVEARSYQRIEVFIFRFEDDATGADKDAITFSDCMRDVFGINDVEDFAIERTSKFVGYDVHRRICAKVDRLLRLQLISENGSQKMFWSNIHDYILASTDDYMENLDVFAMLDCCYAGSAVCAGGNRSVQLLASCEDRHGVCSRTDAVSFTERFRQAAYALANAGNLSVSVESLFSELQRLRPSGAPDAVHEIIGNARPLVLSVPKSSSNETNVLLKISLTGGPSDVILNDFLQLTKTIPPEFKVTLENA